MMLAYRLVRLIETHAETLATTLLERVQHCDFTSAYSKVPPEELKQRAYEVYQHLGEWLLGQSNAAMERRYREIGARRYQQGVPLSEVMWAIALTKDNLCGFVKWESCAEGALEIFGELELLELLGPFFDRAIYYAVMGYEEARETEDVAEVDLERVTDWQ